MGRRADEERRSPSRHSAVHPARWRTPSAGRSGVRSPCWWRGGSPSDRAVPRAAAARRAAADHRDTGTSGRRPILARPDSPPRAPHGGAGDRAWRDWTTWSALRGPSDGRDAPDRTVVRTPGSGSPCPDGGAPAATPAEWSGSAPRPPRCSRPRRASSPPGSRRTPAAGTFPRKRAARPRGRTGPAVPRRPAPRRRHGPRPGTAPRDAGVETVMKRRLREQR